MRHSAIETVRDLRPALMTRSDRAKHVDGEADVDAEQKRRVGVYATQYAKCKVIDYAGCEAVSSDAIERSVSTRHSHEGAD